MRPLLKKYAAGNTKILFDSFFKIAVPFVGEHQPDASEWVAGHVPRRTAPRPDMMILRRPALAARVSRRERRLPGQVPGPDNRRSGLAPPPRAARQGRSAAPATAGPLLTEGEVAELLGVSCRTVRRWRDRGLLPFVKIAGTVRIRLSDLDRVSRPGGDADPEAAI